MTTLNAIQLNPQYTASLDKWSQVRDAVNDDVEKNATAKGYIIKPAGMSEENYKAYVNRAVFKNFVGQTVDVQKGAAFSKEFNFTGPEGSDLPESLAYLVDNVDGSGTSLEDQIKSVGQDVFSIGRIGAMVEYRSGGSGSKADSNRAKIVTYTAESIHDWEESYTIEVDNKLIYVLLVETYSKLFNGSRTNVERKIELKLDEDGFYVQTITDDGQIVGEPSMPLLGNGQRMDFIPFKFIGSDNNKPDVSRVPMFKLSTINIAHYRGDADKRTNIHLFSVPTVAFNLSSDVDPQRFAEINNLTDASGKIAKSPTVGGTAYIGCDITYAQASTDAFLLTCQDADVSDMIKLGAQVITEGHAETAEAARIRKAAGTASLGDMVGNIEDAYKDLFMWCSMMNNGNGQADEFVFEMNMKFFDDRLNPQMLQQLITGVMSNQIPQDVLFKAMKRDGSLGVNDDMTLEDYQALLSEQQTNNPSLNI